MSRLRLSSNSAPFEYLSLTNFFSACGNSPRVAIPLSPLLIFFKSLSGPLPTCLRKRVGSAWRLWLLIRFRISVLLTDFPNFRGGLVACWRSLNFCRDTWGTTPSGQCMEFQLLRLLSKSDQSMGSNRRDLVFRKRKTETSLACLLSTRDNILLSSSPRLSVSLLQSPKFDSGLLDHEEGKFASSSEGGLSLSEFLSSESSGLWVPCWGSVTPRWWSEWGRSTIEVCGWYATRSWRSGISDSTNPGTV